MGAMVIFKWIPGLSYFIVMTLYIRFFIKQTEKYGKLLTPALSVTLILHFAYLIAFTHITKHLPVSNIFEMMTSNVFVFTFIYLMIERVIHERALGVIIVIIAFVLQVISSIFLDLDKSTAAILSEMSFYEIHVVTMQLAYSGFTISFISSLMYILLSREIHKKRLGFFFSRLPSLELMDRLSNLAVIIGFGFISIGIIIGILMASKVWGARWPLDPKLISVFLTWGIYFAFVYFRNFRDWQGNRASMLSIIGFIWIFISVLVFSIFLSKIHSFI